MEFSLTASTHSATSLRALLGDPTDLDRAAIATRMRSIDAELWRHAGAVAAYVGAMSDLLRRSEVAQREHLVDAAWMHDIGKLTISPETLLRPGPLSEAEWADMREHPSRGAGYVQCSKAFAGLAQIIRHHHEWFDGSGYPDRLAGNAIVLGARLIGVADAYDAMTSWRVYRPALVDQDAIAELQRCAGTQFDPDIVDLFIRATAGLRSKVA